MGEPKSIIPFIAPKFNWQADNLYAHFQIFKDKVTFAFDGQFKEANKESKCGAILNWMGDEKEFYKCGKEGHFAHLCHSGTKSTSRSSSSTQKGNSKPQHQS